jgi:hypothetical protein
VGEPFRIPIDEARFAEKKRSRVQMSSRTPACARYASAAAASASSRSRGGRGSRSVVAFCVRVPCERIQRRSLFRRARNARRLGLYKKAYRCGSRGLNSTACSIRAMASSGRAAPHHREGEREVSLLVLSSTVALQLRDSLCIVARHALSAVESA